MIQRDMIHSLWCCAIWYIRYDALDMMQCDMIHSIWYIQYDAMRYDAVRYDTFNMIQRLLSSSAKASSATSLWRRRWEVMRDYERLHCCVDTCHITAQHILSSRAVRWVTRITPHQLSPSTACTTEISIRLVPSLSLTCLLVSNSCSAVLTALMNRDWSTCDWRKRGGNEGEGEGGRRGEEGWEGGQEAELQCRSRRSRVSVITCGTCWWLVRRSPRPVSSPISQSIGKAHSEACLLDFP